MDKQEGPPLGMSNKREEEGGDRILKNVGFDLQIDREREREREEPVNLILTGIDQLFDLQY